MSYLFVGLCHTTADWRSYVDRTDTIIDQYCRGRISHNATLASVKLQSIKTGKDIDQQKLLVSTCREYFGRYCTKVTCFQDLRPYVAGLDRQNRADLLEAMRSYALDLRPAIDAHDVSISLTPVVMDFAHCWQAARLHWVTAETNAMKFEYHFIVSRDDNTQLDDLLPAFVSNCVRLYKCSLQYDFRLPPSDRLPGDDAAILAAMALVRMYRLRHVSPGWAYSLLRSVALLNFAHSKSPHNYDILLILIRIYMYLGTASLALELWNKLSVKNLQNLTVSWMLFTRLSTLHPHPVRVPGVDKQMITIDPLKETVTALNWHQRASQLNLQSTDVFRTNGQWLMQLDALEAKSALESGFSRLMLLGESSRMRRLRYPGHPTDDGPRRPIRLPQKITDTRDSTAFPNYEAHGQLEFWRICPSVEFGGTTVTNEKWIAANLHEAYVWDELRGVDNAMVEKSDLEALSATYDQQADSFTNIEKVLFNIGQLIQKSLDQLQPTAPQSSLLSDSIGQILLQINALSKQGTDRTSDAKDDSTKTHFDTDLHTRYCMLDICQLVREFVTAVQKADRSEFWMKKVLADLQASCKKMATNVWKSAVDLHADVEKEGFVNDLYQGCGKEDEIGISLRDLHGDPVILRDFLSMLQKSWVDALEGVIKTKVVE